MTLLRKSSCSNCDGCFSNASLMWWSEPQITVLSAKVCGAVRLQAAPETEWTITLKLNYHLRVSQVSLEVMEKLNLFTNNTTAPNFDIHPDKGPAFKNIAFSNMSTGCFQLATNFKHIVCSNEERFWWILLFLTFSENKKLFLWKLSHLWQYTINICPR